MSKFKLTRLCFCILLLLLCAAPAAAAGPVTLTSISPTSCTAGAATFTLTATGTNFVVGALVQWNGTSQTTKYVSSTQLTATIPASLVTSPGTATVTILVVGRLASTSPGLTFTINPGTTTTTTTTVSSNSNPSTCGNPVTFTATVSPSTATGTVTFYDGSTSIGTGTLGSGAATYSTSSLSAGSHSITASYGGDSNDAASTSSALTQQVAPVISSLSPTSGPPQMALTISGAGFGSQGSGAVTVNGVSATIVANEWSNTSITVLVPALSPGTVPVIVTVNGIPSGSVSFVVTLGWVCP